MTQGDIQPEPQPKTTFFDRIPPLHSTGMIQIYVLVIVIIWYIRINK